MRRARKVILLIVVGIVVLAALSYAALSVFRGSLYNDRDTSRRLTVATITMTCDPSPAANLVKMAAYVRRVKADHPDVGLILFGETVTGWYAMKGRTAEYLREIAEPIPGNATTVISAAAAEARVYVSFGMAETDGKSLYNTQVVIDPSGNILGTHRKVNLQGGSIYTPGTVPVTMVDVSGISTAVIVCSDIQSRGVRKALSARKPELILGSLANPSDRGWFVSGLIAKMAGTWIVTANRYGQEGSQFFDGQTVVGDPFGNLRVKARGSEQYVVFDIGFDSAPSPVRRSLLSLYRVESLAVHVMSGFRLLVPTR